MILLILFLLFLFPFYVIVDIMSCDDSSKEETIVFWAVFMILMAINVSASMIIGLLLKGV